MAAASRFVKMSVRVLSRQLTVRGLCFLSAVSRLSTAAQTAEAKLVLWKSAQQASRIIQLLVLPGKNIVPSAACLSNNFSHRNISYSRCIASKTSAKEPAASVDPDEVCQVFDQTEKLVGQMKVVEAEELARKENLRLVAMGKNADGLASFRLMSGRALAEEVKRQRAQQKKEKVKEKEFRVKSNITDHDLEIKLRQVRDTIVKGDHVKFVIRAQKRMTEENADRALAQVMKKVTSDIQDVAQIKQGVRNPTELQLLIRPLPSSTPQQDVGR